MHYFCSSDVIAGIQVAERSWQNLNAVADASRSREITCLCWGNDEKSELCAGLRDNCVLTFGASGASAREDGPFFGASGHIKTVAKYEDKFITGFSEGTVAVWSGSCGEEDAVKISTGDNLWAVAQNKAEPGTIATGGKENPLKLWDLSKPDMPIFTAKNVRNDWLNLRVPVWVTKIQFLGDSHRVVTGNGGNQVRVYDPKSPQRRPVVDVNFLSHPITALSVCPLREEQVVVGNTLGDMGLVDVRKGKVVQLYKGFSGGITDLQCHPAAPVVVSCSVDRYVRVHSLDSKAMEDKFYLKSRLNCLILSDQWTPDEEQQAGITEKTPGRKEVQERGDSDDENEGSDDAMWDNLDVVSTKTVTVTGVGEKSGQKRRKSKEQEKGVPPSQNKKQKKKKSLQQ